MILTRIKNEEKRRITWVLQDAGLKEISEKF